MDESTLYPVVEIFRSLQGEGFNTGREMLFLRLGGCNLNCPWCDTDFTRYEMMSAAEILRRIDSYGVKALLVTGGEPLIVRGLQALIEEFRSSGYWVAVETNGLAVAERGVLKLFDYITVSPKVCYAKCYYEATAVTRAHEVRVVAESNALEFCRFAGQRIKAKRYYISPCEREGVIDIEAGVRLLGALNQGDAQPPWLLSLQTHKLCGLR
jgi:7-carboxy-7-deazaguanine synthase